MSYGGLQQGAAGLGTDYFSCENWQCDKMLSDLIAGASPVLKAGTAPIFASPDRKLTVVQGALLAGIIGTVAVLGYKYLTGK